MLGEGRRTKLGRILLKRLDYWEFRRNREEIDHESRKWSTG
jgi:hypothetical protein